MKPISDYERAAQSLDKDASRAGNTVELTCGADLTPEPVRWLWREWLALGKLHLLAGRPGEGKTTHRDGLGRDSHAWQYLAR